MRTNVSIVLGVQTVVRDTQNYLPVTLGSLLDGMGAERDDCLVVVFVGETNRTKVCLHFGGSDG